MDKSIEIKLRLEGEDKIASLSDLMAGIATNADQIPQNVNKNFVKLLTTIQEAGATMQKISENMTKSVQEVAKELNIKGFEGKQEKGENKEISIKGFEDIIAKLKEGSLDSAKIIIKASEEVSENIKKLDFFDSDKNNKDAQLLKDLQANTVIKSEYGIINYEKTKNNREQLKVLLEQSLSDLEAYKIGFDATFMQVTDGMDKNSQEYKNFLETKERALIDYNIKSEQLNLAIGKNTKDLFFSESEYLKSLADKMSEQVTNFTTSLNTGLGFLQGASKARLAMIDEELKETTGKYNKAVEARKASDAALADLHNKSVNLSGGRSEAMQQQVDAEMAKNEELKAQESQLAAEKAKIEKKKAQEEKKSKKIEITQGIVSSTASIAQGIAKALSLGPIAGPIMAAMLAAMGAIQIKAQYKQLQNIDKKADGGLLRGRRHSEGGMRIEGTNIEVEGGEYVINRSTTGQNLGLIRYINSQRRPLGEDDIASYFRSPRAIHTPLWRQQMGNGGMMPTVQFEETMSRDNALLLEAISKIRIDSRVAVTNIIRAQERMTEVDNWVGMK